MKVKTYENKRKSTFPRKSYVPQACAWDNNNDPEEFDKLFENYVNTGKSNSSISAKSTTIGAKSKTISQILRKHRTKKLKKSTLFEDKSSDGSITSVSSSALKSKYSRLHTRQIYSSDGSQTGKIIKAKYKYESIREKERRKRTKISNLQKKSNLLGGDSYNSELFGVKNKPRNETNYPDIDKSNIFASTAIGKTNFERIKAGKMDPTSRVNCDIDLNVTEMSFSDFLPRNKKTKIKQKSNAISSVCPSLDLKNHLNTPNKENFDSLNFKNSPIAYSTPTYRPKPSVFADRANISKGYTPSKTNFEIDKSDILNVTYMKLDRAETEQKLDQTGRADNSNIRSDSLSLARKIATPLNKSSFSKKKITFPNEIDASNVDISALFNSSPNFVTAGCDSLFLGTPIKKYSVASKASNGIKYEEAASSNHQNRNASFSKSPSPNIETYDMARISMRTKFSTRRSVRSKCPSAASTYSSEISRPTKFSKINSPLKFRAEIIKSTEISDPPELCKVSSSPSRFFTQSKFSDEISSPPILSKFNVPPTRLRTEIDELARHFIPIESPTKLFTGITNASSQLRKNNPPSKITAGICNSSTFLSEISTAPKLCEISALSKHSTSASAPAKLSNEFSAPAKLSNEFSAPPELSEIGSPLKFLPESAIMKQSIEIRARSKSSGGIITPPLQLSNDVTYSEVASFTPRDSYHVEQLPDEEIDDSDYSPDLFYTSRKRAERQRRQSFYIAAPHFDDSAAENSSPKNLSAHSLSGSNDDNNVIVRPNDHSLRSFNSLDVTGIESPRSCDQSLPYLVDSEVENKYNGDEVNESTENFSTSDENIPRTRALMKRIVRISTSDIENVSTNSNIDELANGNEGSLIDENLSHTEEYQYAKCIDRISASSIDENISANCNIDESVNDNEGFTSYETVSDNDSRYEEISTRYTEDVDGLTEDNENISTSSVDDNLFTKSRNNESMKSIENLSECCTEGGSSKSSQIEDLTKRIDNLSANRRCESFYVDTKCIDHSTSRPENISSTNALIDELTKCIENLSTNCGQRLLTSRIENISISDSEIEESRNRIENIVISTSQIEDITKGLENLSTGYNEKVSDDLTNDVEKSGSTLYLPHGKKYKRSIIYLKNIIENPSTIDLDNTRAKGKNYLKNLEFLVSNQVSSNNSELFGSVRGMAFSFAEKSINDIGSSSKYESFFQSLSNSRYSFDQTAKQGARFSLTSKPADQVTNATKLSGIVERSEEEETSFSSPNVSFIDCLEPRELVLKKCGQTDVLPFEELFPAETLRDCKKIGEGVYGEVFKLKRKRNHVSIVKIIPIEGDQLVNEEKQKTFDEISSEIIITTELSNLKYGRKNNMTTNFVGVQNCFCVRGAYPKKLIDLWDEYDEAVGSDNDSPKIFRADQQFIIFELDYGGTCVESFPFTSALQSYSAFQQTILGLAVAEAAFQFEHRDLHLGNILLSRCKEREIAYNINGERFVVRSHGIKVTIIDFTLSRISYNGKIFFNDLASDPLLFVAQGDFQFEVYRLMQREVDNCWDVFAPKTHVFWLRYLADKLLNVVEYKRKSCKTHLDALHSMRGILDFLDDYESAVHLTSIFRS